MEQNATNKSIKELSKTEKKKRKKLVLMYWFIKDITFITGMIVFSLLIITLFIIPKHMTIIIPSASMENTLNIQDIVYVKDLKQDFEINRNDIVLFEDEYGILEKPNEKFIKRVVGLPNEHIVFMTDYILVNGEVLEDSHYIKERAYYEEYEIVLKDDEYFVMGDNRNRSLDSRSYGPIKKHQIKGLAKYTVFPFKNIKKL